MSLQVYPSAVRGLGFTVTKAPEDAVIKQQSPSFVQTRIVQNQNPIWHWSLLYDFLVDNPLKPNPSYQYTDLQQLLGFVTARRNSYDDFLFSDPDDNFVGPGVITQSWLPNYPFMLGAIIVVGGNAWQVSSAPGGAKSGLVQPGFGGTTQADGGLSWYKLGAAIGGTAWPNPQAQLQLVTDGTTYYSPIQLNRGGQFWEDVTDISNGINVYADGVLTTAYTLYPGGLSFSGFSSSGLYLNWGSTPPATPVTAEFNYFYRVHFEDDTQDFEKWANQWWTVGGSQGSRGKGELKLSTSRLPQSIGPGGNPPFPPFSFSSVGGGATNLMVLYPKNVTVSYGSGPGTFTGYAVAKAGSGAWFMVELNYQGLGSAGGSAQFSVYPDPGIARSRITAVYSYIPWMHPQSQAGPLTNGFASSSAQANGIGMIGGALSTAIGTFITQSGGALISLLQGGVSNVNLDFSTIKQNVGEGHSIQGFYGSKMLGNPMVLVYYS